MRGNPTVDEMLEQMRRRRGIRSGRKSLDPTFKRFSLSGLYGDDCREPDLWDTDQDMVEVFLVDDDEVDDGMLESILLHEEHEPAPPRWRQATKWAFDRAGRIVKPVVTRIQEDRELAEVIMGLAVLAAGTAAGLFWHAYRAPITSTCATVVDFVVWIAAILRR